MSIAVMGAGRLGGHASGLPTPLNRAIADILALRAGGAAS